MKHKVVSHTFFLKIFLSLILIGLLQIFLLGVFSILFSSKIIEDNYGKQASSRIEILGNEINLKTQKYREILNLFSHSPKINALLREERSYNKTELSQFYQYVYKAIEGHIDGVSFFFVNYKHGYNYSTHVIPRRYNPNSSDESFLTFVKQKGPGKSFSIVDSFVNPKGDQVALTLVQPMLFTPKIKEDSYIIADLNLNIFEIALQQLNMDFFSDIYFIDLKNYKYVNLLKDTDNGDFSHLKWSISSLKERNSYLENGFLITSFPLYSKDLLLVGTLRVDSIKSNVSLILRVMFIGSILGLFLSSIVSFLLARSINAPLKKLVDAMEQAEKGDFNVRLSHREGDEFALLFSGFNKMSQEIKELIDLRLKKEKALRVAERKALQSQINPHFLYNTLNTVKSLSKLHGVHDITVIITQLGKLLRDSIDSRDKFTTLGAALEIAQSYLEIQSIRYDSSFQWTIFCPNSVKEIKIPRLLIQPIIENSVIHGLEPLMGQKELRIECFEEPLRIEVLDNGDGMTEETFEEALNGKRGIGFQNVNERLKLYYGQKNILKYKREGNWSKFIIPLKEKPNNE